MFSLRHNWRRNGGEIQRMYTHVRKYKNNKIKGRRKEKTKIKQEAWNAGTHLLLQLYCMGQKILI
jgi:hypothetical protein